MNSILCKHAQEPMNGQDKKMLKDVIPILKLFDNMTKSFSSEKTVTASKILSIIDFMYSELEEYKMTTLEGQDFKAVVLKEFSRRFSGAEKHHIPAIASVLDSRYKKILFSDPINASKGEEYRSILLTL